MDVLNTYGGGVDYDVTKIVFGLVLFILLGILTVITWLAKERGLSVPIGMLAVIGLLGALINVINPIQVAVRHEVTLRQGYVIDATKYEIVEQRGQIYVIEERGNAE